jgi:peptide/nickel transport system substrate-binding protein
MGQRRMVIRDGRIAIAAEPTLIWAEVAEPRTVDPAKADVNQEMTIIRNAYDRPLNYNLDHPDQILPSLATSWKQDDTEWTLTLRDGVKTSGWPPFHGG